MKREDALNIIRNRWKQDREKIMWEERLVDILIDLGILKLDQESPSAYKVIREVVGDDFQIRDTAQLILDHLAINGYKVVKI